MPARIALTKPCIEADDLAAVRRATDARAFAQGELVHRFEKSFAELLGGVGAVATNSCTSALMLALRTVGVGPGDEVILPSYTCLAVPNAVVQVGAVPRLVDNEVDVAAMNYNISSRTIRPRLGAKTRAIILPHMFGVAAAVDEVVALGVPVIEDITLSLGARYRGALVGTFAPIAVCSFHESKMISSGEGGMLVARDPALLRRARYLNGWEEEQVAARLDESRRLAYEVRFNFHMTELSAALGQSQLEKLPRFLERRRALAQRYVSRLSALPQVQLPRVDGENQFFRFLVAASSRAIPSTLRRFNDANIEVGRGVYPPLHRYFEPEGSFPGAERAIASLLSIPLYPALTDEEVERILDTTCEILSEATS